MGFRGVGKIGEATGICRGIGGFWWGWSDLGLVGLMVTCGVWGLAGSGD